MSNSKETCLWSYQGGCVVQDKILPVAEQIKEFLNLPSDIDSIKLIKTIGLRLKEAPSTDKNRKEVTKLVTDLLKYSISGCNNCAFKKAVKSSAKSR